MTKQHVSGSAAPGGASSDLTEIFGPPIHVVTRQQLIDDGHLIDVSSVGREAGIRVNVAVTREVWADCVEWNAEDSLRQTHQDQDGRLWDVLWMAKDCAVRNARSQSAIFIVFRVPRGGAGYKPVAKELKLVLSQDDEGKPCFTILEPDQD